MNKQELLNKIVQEGDLYNFEYKGYNCEIKRVEWSKHLCGYVDLLKADWDSDYYDEISCHGGITYNQDSEDGYYRIGFDTAHCGDLLPENAFKNISEFNYSTYKDKEYCIEQCKTIVDQLIKFKEENRGDEKMKIVGLRIEKYIGQNIEGHNCDFNYIDEEMERHILLGLLSDGRKVLITLEQSYGECGSGWCTASWGEIDVKEVDNFEGYTYRPIKELIIDDITPEHCRNFQDSGYDDVAINNEVFTLSIDGGDGYYPSGYYTVNMELFEETVRAKDKRPVWIFKGDSNSGKSFLSHKLSGLTAYETDMSNTLPDSIKEDVVVIGNKYKFSIEDVQSKLFGDVEVTVVDFGILK